MAGRAPGVRGGAAGKRALGPPQGQQAARAGVSVTRCSCGALGVLYLFTLIGVIDRHLGRGHVQVRQVLGTYRGCALYLGSATLADYISVIGGNLQIQHA